MAEARGREVRVLFDPAREQVVYVEAGGFFVDLLVAQLLVPVGQLAAHAAKAPGELAPVEPAALHPLSALQASVTKLVDSIQGADNDVPPLAKLLDPKTSWLISDVNLDDVSASRKLFSFAPPPGPVPLKCSNNNNNPCACRHCNQQMFHTESSNKVCAITSSLRCSCAWCGNGTARQGLAPQREAQFTDIKTLLLPNSLFVVSPGLGVQQSSTIVGFEMLRQHEPDSSKWGEMVGLSVRVNASTLRSIARATLAGRPNVLNDAFGEAACSAWAARRSGTGDDPDTLSTGSFEDIATDRLEMTE